LDVRGAEAEHAARCRTSPSAGGAVMTGKISVVTVSIVITHDADEDPIQILRDSIARDHEGRLGELIEPHVDSTEDEE
jgi:hypothetical protein